MITKENTLRGTTVEEADGQRLQVVEILRADGSVIRDLAGGPFAWGAPTRSRGLDAIKTDNEGRINLSKALLGWLLGNPGDPRVTQYFGRVKHRVAMTLSNNWTMRVADIRAVVEDIMNVEHETARGRTMVAMTPSPIVTEGGGGIIWDTDERGNRITRPGE